MLKKKLEVNNTIIPKHKGEKNYNKNILKLARKLTGRIGYKVSTKDPEYWGLACLLTDEMAQVALTMEIRTPYTLEMLIDMNKELADKLGKNEFQAMLDEMGRVGVLEFNYGDHYTDDGPVADIIKVKNYVLPVLVPGSGEFSNMNEELMKEHPELALFFERMTFLPLEKVAAMIPPGGAGVGMHVIPVEKAISMENESVKIEHISHWLKKYNGHIGASICSCRHGRKTLGEGCADDFHDWCIVLGDMADFCVETGRGRYITYEEAMDILQRAEDNGYVHQVTNIDGEEKIFAICNCNVNVCNALRSSQLFNTPNLSRSAYVAKVDKDKCVACGGCVEYCPAGAVKLGQKLCKSDGEEVVYPKHELPNAKKWGKSHWDENYRDNNRINCYDTGTSPCKTACPAHVAVQGYIKKAAQGKYTEALALIKRENPFPAICGRVCNRRCEDACTRGTLDRAVSIDEIKKFIAQKDLYEDTRYVPPIVVGSNRGRWKEKVAIIGGGPAGLSCAYYLASKGYYPTVFEKEDKPGGMMMYGIPSYKLEKDVIDAEIDILREMGVDIQCNVEVGEDITLQELRQQGYKAFYMAIGCGMGKIPEIPGKEVRGVQTALQFLKKANTGNENVTERVVVIGGGNVAIDAARVAIRSGADYVKMYCLESKNEMPASQEEIIEAREDGVEINCGWGPVEIIRNGYRISGIKLKRCVSVYDNDNRFNPEYDESTTITVPCEKVIFATGQTIDWGTLKSQLDVEYVHGDYPEADKLTYQTSQEDVFVGGDMYTGPGFVIDAIAQGHEAAESIHRYVQQASMTIGRNKRHFIELNKKDISVESYDRTNRQENPKNNNYWRTVEGGNCSIKGTTAHTVAFKEMSELLTEEQVLKETARCLGCGASIVDENKCIGCGVCTTKCSFDAISLHRERPECSRMIKTENKMGPIISYNAKRAIKIVTRRKQ